MSADNKERLDYRDLESDLHDAVNMSVVASERMGDFVGSTNRIAEGVYRLTDQEIALMHFLVFQTEQKIEAVLKKWNEIHDNNTGQAEIEAVAA